jgi:hypothetical protein
LWTLAHEASIDLRARKSRYREEVGEHVTTLKKGDRVLVNAVIAEVTDNGELGQGLPGKPTCYGVGD